MPLQPLRIPIPDTTEVPEEREALKEASKRLEETLRGCEEVDLEVHWTWL